MGWTDSHAHEFQIGAGIVAPDWWIHEAGFDTDTREYRDERRVSVAPVTAELGAGGDVGGSGGYELFLEALADWEHEQHQDMVRWIGGVFGPKGFDLNRLNRPD
jgi:hypothetical protein